MGAVRQLFPLLLSCTLLLTANGLLFIVVPMSMRLGGAPTDTIGMVTSMYFLGMLFGSLYGRHLIDRVGHIRIFAACAAIATFSALIYSIWESHILWGMLRIVAGLCNAILFITMETWLSDSSTPKNRGAIFGSYQFVTYLGLTIGQMMLALANPQDNILFIFAAGLFCLCMLPVLLSRSGGPRITEPAAMKITTLYKVSPLGVVGVFMSGITLGAFYNMSTVFAANKGMSTGDIAIFMGATMLGGFLLQFPVGKLSDIYDRRAVLLFNLMVACFFAFLMPLVASSDNMPITIFCAIMLSGTLACVYPIALADAFDRLQPHEMVSASGKLILAYAIGGVIGPYSSSLLMEFFGSGALFGYLAILSGSLMGFVIYRKTVRSPVPEALQETFVVLGPTPLATNLDPRTEFQGVEKNSVAADTVISLAAENPEDLLSIVTNVVAQHPEDACNIAASVAFNYPNQAAQVAITLSKEFPEQQVEIVSHVAGVAPIASSQLAKFMCVEIANQSLDSLRTSKALVQLTQQMLEQAPLQATEIATIVSQEVPESMPEMVAEIVLIAAQAAPEQRIEVATAVIQEIPEASVEVAASVVESIAAGPEDELHTFLAAEENDNYLGEAAELAAVVAQEVPEQVADVATVLLEAVPENASQVVESLAQADPENYLGWVEEIVEAVPEAAEEINQATRVAMQASPTD